MKRLPLVVIAIGLTACRREQSPADASSHEGHEAAVPASDHVNHGEQATPVAHVTPEAAQALGLHTERPRRGVAAPSLRAPAVVRWDPIAITRVTTRLSGQVRRLDLPREGERVAAGQAVAWLDSPQARSLFAELRVADGLGSPWREAARDRLIRSGIDSGLVDRALASGEAPDLLPVRSQVAGVVVERTAGVGAWLPAGASLAAVAAQDALVAEATISGAAPSADAPLSLLDPTTGQLWPAHLAAVLPTGGAAGALIRIRVDGAPAVGRPYVIEWTAAPSEGLWIPRSAVTDTGERRVVFVATADGYEPRPVETGRRTADEIEVLSGIDDQDAVVVAGTFLLDSETQLRGTGHGAHR